jgi:hypothetical protein
MLGSQKALRDTATMNATREYQTNRLEELQSFDVTHQGQGPGDKTNTGGSFCISRRRLTHHIWLSCHALRAYIRPVRRSQPCLPGVGREPAIYASQSTLYPGQESKLPYLSATMKESFRLMSLFQLPLPRVIPAGGQSMAGQHIPGGMVVSSMQYRLGQSRRIY